MKKDFIKNIPFGRPLPGLDRMKREELQADESIFTVDRRSRESTTLPITLKRYFFNYVQFFFMNSFL